MKFVYILFLIAAAVAINNVQFKEIRVTIRVSA